IRLSSVEGKWAPDQVRGDESSFVSGSRRPGTKSLWLLPSGPDQIGDSAVRRLRVAHMGEAPGTCKLGGNLSLTIQRSGRISACPEPESTISLPSLLLGLLAAAAPPSTV